MTLPLEKFEKNTTHFPITLPAIHPFQSSSCLERCIASYHFETYEKIGEKRSKKSQKGVVVTSKQLGPNFSQPYSFQKFLHNAKLCLNIKFRKF